MSPRTSRSSRRQRRTERKDRLIQTRVDGDLEQALKQEAARRRLTVSHLIRNTLEDAFDLVEDVTADVEQLVSGSVELAAAVGREGRRIASMVRGDSPAGASPSDAPVSGPPAPGSAPPPPASAPPPPAPAQSEAPEPRASAAALAAVYGWNRIIANRSAACASCGSEIARGKDALVGLTDEAGPRIWLCEDCGERL